MPVLYFDLWFTMRRFLNRQRDFWEKTIAQAEVTGERHTDLPYLLRDEVVREAVKQGHVAIARMATEWQDLSASGTRLLFAKCLLLCKEVDFLTPPMISKSLGINKVHGWIRRGELVATNITVKPGGRAKYRITLADFEMFKKSKQPVGTKKIRRTKRVARPSLDGETFF
jgi:hypothetical protein